MTDDDVLSALPASYKEIADRFGVGIDTVRKHVARMRKNNHNIRASGKNPHFVLEIVDCDFALAAPKLRSWQDL